MRFSLPPLFRTCLHCFNRINMMNAVFRCAHEGNECVARKDKTFNSGDGSITVKKGQRLTKKPDPVLEAVWRDTEVVSHTFRKFGWNSPLEYDKAENWMKTKANCPASRKETTDRLCPKCHKKLPAMFTSGKERRLTLLGAADSGKSNYIAVVVEELKLRLGSRLNFGMAYLADNGEFYDDYYYNPVYKKMECVKKTQPVLSRSDINAPLVFGLGSRSKRKGQGGLIATLSFFDPPGEGLMIDRNVERFHRSVFNSHGLVLLIDGEELVNDDKGSDAFTDATKVLEVVARRIDADGGGSKRLLPYLAIALSKSDLLGGLEDMRERALKRPDYDRGFDYSDFRVVSSDVERLIRRNGGGNFCNIAEAIFGRDHIGFFAVSAFGCAPVRDNERPDEVKKLPKVEPIRVVDPFLWLMSETGVLGDFEKANS